LIAADQVTPTLLRDDDMAKFRALLVTKDGDRQSIAATELTDADLMEGNVSIAVEHSTVNYKDGLAMTGKAPIIRKFPLIPGISVNSVLTPARSAKRPGVVWRRTSFCKAQQHDLTSEARRRAGFGDRSSRGKNARASGHRSLNTDQCGPDARGPM
jgi:hypothetical protein